MGFNLRQKQTRARGAASLMPSLAIALVATILPIHAVADTLFDDFNGSEGSEPAHSEWTNTQGITIDGLGSVLFDTTSGPQTLEALADWNFRPHPTQRIGRVTFDVTQLLRTNLIFGLVDSSSNAVTVRNDLGSGNFEVVIQSGNSKSAHATGITNATGVWEIDWEASRVRVYRDRLLAFSSTSNPPKGGTRWNIPTTELHPVMVAYTGPGVVAKLNNLTWNTSRIWDDFIGRSGSHPDPTQWIASNGLTLNGNGALRFDVGSGPQGLDAASPHRFSPYARPRVSTAARAILDITQHSPTNLILGLTDGSTRSILVRNDQGDGLYRVVISNGSQSGYYPLGLTNATGTWIIDWMPQRVLIYLDDALEFDSSANAPVGHALWRIPISPLAPTMGTYTGAGVVAQLNRAIWTPVPKRPFELLFFDGIGGSVGGIPTPTNLIDITEQVDRLPADGFVFSVTNTPAYFPDESCRLDTAYTAGDFLAEISTMHALHLEHVNRNFARINIGVSNADWFSDEDWGRVVANVELGADAAAQDGAEGILLDTEMYGSRCCLLPYYYGDCVPAAGCTDPGSPATASRTFAETATEVRARGKQFMQAIVSAFPGAKILYTYATSVVALGDTSFNLLPAFIDGMMDAAPNNTFIDGYEGAYEFKTGKEFAVARNVILNAATLSADPRRYQRKMKVGFGIYPHARESNEVLLDMTPGHDTSEYNNLTPTELADAIQAAYDNSDGYVWLYRFPWLVDSSYLASIYDMRRHLKRQGMRNVTISASPE
jgi:hypothetical protein